jgi:hypothetical protein
MALIFRSRNQAAAPTVQPPTNTPTGDAAEEGTERGVTVTHGIHRGTYPIAGMRLADVRQTLTRLMNIDPAAVVVVNGQVVTDENTTIAEDVRVIAFVKPSSIKGRKMSHA